MILAGKSSAGRLRSLACSIAIMEISRQGHVLSRDWVIALGKSNLAKLRARCTATAKEDGFTKVPVKVCCLRSHPDGSVSLPLFVPLDGLNLPEDHVDTRPPPTELSDFPAFSKELDEARKQPSASEAVLRALRDKGAGILAMGVGFGKTAVSINVACTLRVKTLVVVHKEVLLTQWRERIKSFAPGARVGKIQGKEVDVDDKHFVIGMLQSLSMRTYPEDVLDGFDLVIIDEVHHTGAAVFSKALSRLCAPYSLGLSATPERKDNLTDVINWHLNGVCFEAQRKQDKRTIVEKVRYEQIAYKEAAPTFWNKQLALCKIMDILCNDSIRNSLVIDKVSRLYEEGRNVLVLSDRRSHCTSLHGALVERGANAGLFLGGIKQEVLDSIAESCQVIIGTYAMAAEGLDIPKLNTLVMATPKGDVRQTTGRILRGSGSEVSPKIVDIVDQWGPLIAQANRRDSFYRSCGFDTGSRCIIRGTTQYRP